MEDNVEKYNPEDDDFIIIGGGSDYKKPIPRWIWIAALVLVIAAAIFCVVFIVTHNNSTETPAITSEETAATDVWYDNADASIPSSIVVADTIVDSLHLKILTPYNVVPELCLGPVDTTDSDILLATAPFPKKASRWEWPKIHLFSNKPQRTAALFSANTLLLTMERLWRTSRKTHRFGVLYVS